MGTGGFRADAGEGGVAGEGVVEVRLEVDEEGGGAGEDDGEGDYFVGSCREEWRGRWRGRGRGDGLRGGGKEGVRSGEERNGNGDGGRWRTVVL